MKLSDLKINAYAIILSVNVKNKKVRIRLLEMGLTPGTVVKVTKIAPLGDPIGIFFRGYELCISKKEASYILMRTIRSGEQCSPYGARCAPVHTICSPYGARCVPVHTICALLEARGEL